MQSKSTVIIDWMKQKWRTHKMKPLVVDDGLIELTNITVSAVPNKSNTDAVSSAVTDESEQTGSDMKSEASSEDSGDKWSLKLMCLLAVLILLCSSSVVMSLSSNIIPQISLVSNIHNSAIMGIATGMIILSIAKEKLSWSDVKTRMENQVGIVSIIVFYFFCVAYDIVNIVTDGRCSTDWQVCDHSVESEIGSRASFHVLHIIFNGAIAVFSMVYYGATSPRNSRVNLCVWMIVMANISLWFHTMINEVADRGHQTDDVEIDCASSQNGTSADSGFIRPDGCFDLETGSLYLFPFTVQYALLVCQNLLVPLELSETCIKEIDNFEITGTLSRIRQIRLCHFGSIFLASILVLATFICWYNYIVDTANGGDYIKMYLIGATVCYVVMTIAIVISFILDRECSKRKVEIKKITRIEYVMMFSSLGVLLKLMLDMSATAQLTTLCGFWSDGQDTCDLLDEVSEEIFSSSYVYLFFYGTNIMQVVFQLIFLFVCHIETEKCNFVHVFAAVILQVCNYACWDLEFSAVGNITPSSILYHQETTWKWLSNFLNPFHLFFRFNSIFLFALVVKANIRYDTF